MRRRHRRQLIVAATVLAAIAAAAAVMAAGIRAVWTWQHRHVETLLAEQLQTTSGIGQRLLSDSAAQLERVGGRWTGGCDDDALELLRDLVFHSLVIGEAAFFDQALRAVCTNYGPPPRPFGLHPDAVAALGREKLAVVMNERSPVMGERTIGVDRVLPRGAMSIQINPLLVEQVLVHDVIQPDMWSGLLLKDGTVLAGSGPAVEPALLREAAAAAQPREAGASRFDTADHAPVLYAARHLDGFPVVALASMRAPDLADAWRMGAWPVSVGGLLAGALVAALGYAQLRRGRSMDEELKAAIRHDELEIHYLPIMDLTTQRCIGAEALMRWRHPERGLIRPDLFIPHAEESGMILPMTDWALKRIARDFAGGPPQGAPFHVSINMTGQHFQTPGLVNALTSVFSPSALKPMHLVFEVTERQAVDARDGQATRTIAELRDWGAGVSLDDFGTGYCGLGYLQRYRVDYLKIDKTFTDTIGTEGVLAHVVDTIIDLAHKMKLEVVAEGVERQEQVAYLRARGVRYVQGYLFAKPMPAAPFVEFVRRQGGV